MQCAEEPAKLDVVIEELDATPRMTCGGCVNEREENAGDNLKAQDNGGGATEYVPPTGSAGGNLVYGRRCGGLAKAKAPFEPVVKCDTAFSLIPDMRRTPIWVSR